MSELPRLLRGTAARRPLDHARHLDVHGPLPRGMDLPAAVEAAGLRGHGGAAFPTGRKLRTLAAARRPVVLVNAAEGEPLSRKDRVLCAYAPHLVLDGALAAAAAIGADEVTVALPGTAAAALAAMQAAAAERRLERGVRVVGVPVAYLAGEERALVRHLDGGPLLPTTGPRPFERGLRRRPTLVNNAETLAHVALVARHGPAWFREVGTEAEPGSALVTVVGAVREPGVQEIAIGARLGTLLHDADGPLGPLRAVLVGGFHGVWIDAADIAATTLDDRHLARHGGSLAAGVIVALGTASCPVRELAGVLGWMAGQSAGQCGPCSRGLPAIAGLLDRVAAGTAPRGALETLDRWSVDITGRGACHLPDGAARFLRSGLRVFAPELRRHAQRGPCAACRRPTMITADRRAAA